MKHGILVVIGMALASNLSAQPITVQNGIKRKDLGYYKFFSTHYPKEFNLRVNGQPIEPGKTATVSDSRLVVQYDYVWETAIGTRTGTKQVEFKVPDNQGDTGATDTVSIGFNGWDNKTARINATHAEKVSPEISLESSGDLDTKAVRKKRTRK